MSNSLTLIQWKSFAFFKQHEITPEQYSDNTHIASLWRTIDISCASSSRLHSSASATSDTSPSICLGDGLGFLHLLDKSLHVSSFPAYDKSITHILHFSTRNILVTAGYDDDTFPIIKVWDLDKTDTNKSPLCIRAIKVQYSGKAYSITGLALSSNCNLLAIGLSNGIVTIIKGDLVRDRYTTLRHINEEFKDKGPVTSLDFYDISFSPPGSSSYPSSMLYMTTEAFVAGYRVSVSSETREFLVNDGCNVGCASVNVYGDFLVARPEAVYYYRADGRGPCFILDHVKKSIMPFRNYLVSIGKTNKAMTLDIDGVLIYDLRNKMICFSSTYSAPVLWILEGWDGIYVFTEDKKIYRLEEKSLDDKLKIIYEKDLYNLAVNIAISTNMDEYTIAEIYRKYGDHLYEKADFDSAIEQYIQTIGKLQPSYVILKFLDSQRIPNLTLYLQALHEKNVASPDHTTLLLNCYAKLRDSQRLSEFIKTDKEVLFDVDTAIQVCRSAKYHEYAAYLAEKFNRYEIFIEIQIEDVEDYSRVISYISNLPFFEAEKAMKKYGKILVGNVSEEATSLLVRLCTGKHAGIDNKEQVKPSNDTFNNRTIRKSSPEDYLHNFVNRKRWLSHFLEKYIEEYPECKSVIVWNTLFELYLSPNDDNSENTDQELNSKVKEKALLLLKNPQANYDADHALILSQLHQFLPGILYLYEKSERFRDLLQFHMENNEYLQVLATSKKYSNQMTDLWIDCLHYFASRQDDCNNEISEVLQAIEALGLLQPLQVVEILSRNPRIKLDIVKDYLIRTVEMEIRQMNMDEKELVTLEEECENVKKAIAEVDSEYVFVTHAHPIRNFSAVVIQNTRCTACSFILDLPAVHFLCKHSYHLRCLGENEKECPKCLPDYAKILQQKKDNERIIADDGKFMTNIQESTNGFSVITEYLGRNIFSTI